MASPDEVWLVEFGDLIPGEPGHRRPAVVVGPSPFFGPTFPFVFLVPLTTRASGLSLHVEIEASEATGLDETSYAQFELLRSVSRRRLIDRLGAVDPSTSRSIDAILRTLLGH